MLLVLDTIYFNYQLFCKRGSGGANGVTIVGTSFTPSTGSGSNTGAWNDISSYVTGNLLNTIVTIGVVVEEILIGLQLKLMELFLLIFNQVIMDSTFHLMKLTNRRR